MSETKQDCQKMLNYMKENNALYIQNIGINEFLNRIKKLKKQIKTGISQ